MGLQWRPSGMLLSEPAAGEHFIAPGLL
jgi:hypothetical protein